ncbi:hypothetical protein G6L41_008575 [Agrobacterium tumefaciens]|uniref:hypothetical protein n=1 Tax=Agrobacterium tumefaciens TaxID=358 RepID=UPI001574129E|nr:hypothetical protein [Agrobacterium tumefaciens]WCK12323.1 hypothetical protein G6L41_008575 [Agrobacterium tumefaciens]
MIDDVSTCYTESHQLVQNIRKMVGLESLAKQGLFNGLTDRLAIKFHASFREFWLTVLSGARLTQPHLRESLCVTADLQIDAGRAVNDLIAMDTIIHAGFESENFTVVRDMTVSELIDIIVKHVDSFQEAMAAADILDPLWTAASYEGTGWRVWYVKRHHDRTLH